MKHSTLSASAADRWVPCPGSIPLSEGVERVSSVYADEGTTAHAVLSAMHTGDDYPAGFTDEMVEHAKTTYDLVRELAGSDGVILSEQRVDYSTYLGQTGKQALSAFGTSDFIVVLDDELIVIDYKYGRGVIVDAEDNRQMKLYALGALQAVGDILGPFERVRLIISQPRAQSAPSEWSCSVAELEAWGRGEARSAAVSVQNAVALLPRADTPESRKVWETTFLRPGEKQCRWCPVKATCNALASEVVQTVAGEAASIDEFDSLTIPGKEHIKPTTDEWLASAMDKADLIEIWLSAVRAEVERRLVAGIPVKGYKLVQGRQGDRKWQDPKVAEETLKGYRLKVEEMYDLKLISPTTAEKLAAAKVIGPRQWPKLQEQITRAPGSPHVAKESDKRPSIKVTKTATVEEFDAETGDAPAAEFV